MIVIALAMAITFVFSRCSTDVDLNAPYMSQPIVFGLLDAEQDTQWVKINRTWLGDGDQNVYAQVQDSSEYESHRVQASIYSENGVEFELIETLLDNKDDGSFWGPEYKAYYALTPEGKRLETDSLYTLEVLIDDTLKVSSTTDLIHTGVGNITQPPLGDIPMSFANVGPSQVTYPDYTFKWYTTEGASRYDAVLSVHYKEIYWVDEDLTIKEDSAYKTLEIPIGTMEPNNNEGGDQITKVFSGSSFYSFLSSSLEKNPRITRVLGEWDEEEQRVFAFDFELMIANEDLAIYLDVNAPTTNILQERPNYNNIDGGLGLWASRSIQGVYNLGYTTDTIEHLQEGDETAELNFCSPNPFSDYYCN